MRTAIVVGATGLVGRKLTEQLLAAASYQRVKVFVRRPTGIDDPGLDEHFVDFDLIERWKDGISGDVLFSTLGTTRKQAKSKEAQYRVDFSYQYETARAAAENGVEKYVLVSAAGANNRSRLFYPRMKGQLEEEISKLPFRKIVILRPSILIGERREKRAGERLGARGVEAISRIVPPLRKYRPIPAEIVARAMINSVAGEAQTGFDIISLDEIFAVGQASA